MTEPHGYDGEDPDVDDFDEDCGVCGGSGYVHDCGEDTCCCADPESQDMEQCPWCGGEGR